MNAEQRTQVRKILEYRRATATRDFEERRTAIYADHSAKGCLQSGGTIRAVIRIMEEIGAAFLTESIEQVSAVAQDVEAFAALQAGYDDHWNLLASELASTVNMASGRHVTDDRSDSASRAATLPFEKSRGLVSQKLELYRFTFTRPAPAKPFELVRSGQSPKLASGVNSPPKGGRPIAQHWDDMWAATAVALFTGDLKPKSQADIEAAMLTWLETNGFSAANSTVRGRARRLWDRLQAEK